jgi:hypothetical protein
MFSDSDSPYPRSSVTDEDVETFAEFIRRNPQIWDPEQVRRRYRHCGLPFIDDPFDPALATRIVEALREGKPFSAIRIGDGEANIAGYKYYRETPSLNRHALAASIGNRRDSFSPTEAWLDKLNALMNAAIASADVVGVLGIWRTKRTTEIDLETIVDDFKKDYRGITGHIRGVDFLIRLAEDGRLNSKLIAPAHFYFGLAQRLKTLLSATEHLICITNRTDMVRKLQTQNPALKITHIPVGTVGRHGRNKHPHPVFLDEVRAQLPGQARGCLHLIGAGVWAELYCNWIKENGGVAVDLGSGFDLLSGRLTRPVHRRMPRALLDDIIL